MRGGRAERHGRDPHAPRRGRQRALQRGIAGPDGGGVARPRVDGHAAARGDFRQDGAEAAFQRGQVVRVIGAQVDREGEVAGHDGDLVLRRIGVEAPDGEGHGAAGGLLLRPHRIEGGEDLRPRQGGVAAEAAGQADMRILPHDADGGVADIARDAGAHGDRHAGFEKARRLFDMGFEEAADRAGRQQAAARRDRRGIAAAARDVVRQGQPGIRAAAFQRIRRQDAERRAAAEQAEAEPDRFLAAEGGDGDVRGRGEARGVQGRDGGERRDHARRPVVVAAMAHAVEMRADQDARRRAIRARPGHGEVAGGVLRHLEPEAPRLPDRERMGGVLALIEGVARDAGRVGADLGQAVEHRLHARAFIRQRGGQRHAPISASTSAVCCPSPGAGACQWPRPGSMGSGTSPSCGCFTRAAAP